MSSSSEEDDGDIFAQFTGGSSKKKEQLLKKKPVQPVQQAVVEEKKEEPLKACVMVKLVQFDDESNKKKEHQEIWKLEMDLDFKKKIVKCISSPRRFAFLVNEIQANNEEHMILYIYDFKATKYMGFINLTLNLGVPDLSKIPMDLIFSSGALKGCLTIFTRDTLYLIAENSRNGQPGKWSLIRKIENVIGLDKKFDFTQIKIHESFLKKQVLIVNKNIVSVQDKFVIKELLKPNDENKAGSVIIKYPLHQIYTQSQKSFSIFDPKVLRNLYVKGYTSIVLKILVQLLKILDSSSHTMASDFLDLDLADLMDEVQQHIDALNLAQAPGGGAANGKKKQETASSIFDDFYGSVLDQNPYSNLAGKKEDTKESKKAANDKMLEQEFEEGFGKLLNLVRTNGEKILGLKNFNQRAQLIDFIRRFKSIYKKEFFADNLTCILLRDLFLQTEDVEEEKQEQILPAQQDGNFNVAQYMSQIKSQLKANVSSVKNWTSLQCCFALHSEMQDVLLNELQDRLDFEQNLNWDLMKRLCLPVWIKDTAKLKALINTVAKNEYRLAGDDFQKSSRAEKTALWYLLIDRKDQLTRLYKQEPQYVKVYELLLNDFSLPKWKTTAEKNAMVLMSKKNNMLACAFFLLAGNLKDALKIASDKLQDPILAVLMARLMEKETQPAAFGNFDDFSGNPKQEEKQQERLLDKIYMDDFIQRGIRLEDPFLQNIGYWQRKEYLQAVNAFHIDPSTLNNMDFFFKQSITDFNLYFNTGELQSNQEKLDAMALLQKLASQSQQEVVILPEPSTYNYYALDFIKALRKSTMVKRSLQQKFWKQDNYSGGGGGGSIFDDFFGGEQQAPKQAIKTEEKKSNETKLIINESQILEYVSGKTATNGYTLQSLIVMAENNEFVEKAGIHCRETLAETIIADFMNSPTFSYTSLRKLKNSATYLVNKFNLDRKQLKSFILRQFGLLDNFLMQVNFLTDLEDKNEDNSQEVLDCVEEWALRITDFIHSLTDFPYALIQDSKDIASIRYIINKAISYLEDLTQSFIIIDMYTKQHTGKQHGKDSEEGKRGVSGGGGGPRIDTTQARKISMTLTDPEAEGGIMEFTFEEEKGNVNIQNFELTQRMSNKAFTLTDKLEEALQTIGSMTRIGVIIYLGLIQVSIAARKFGILKELLEDTRKLFHTADQYQNTESTQAAVVMQKVKTMIQQLQYSIESDESVQKSHEPKEEKTKTAEEQAEETSKRKVNIFLETWIQYIVTHHTVQIIRSSYEKTQIRGLIDQRPSIVQNKPMKQVVEMILNPRVSSSDLLKRFTNQDRMQENVTTYCFENFLSYIQRHAVALELGQLLNNRFEPHNKMSLNIERYFGKDRNFSDFATYLDLGNYIKNLRDHEISLVWHTNQDYSAKVVERTQHLYENGIDIFRMKGEVVSGFAFDHCDMDLVALALQGKGIREIPIKKSLLYRTRMEKGHQVADEEANTWHESLNRFNKVAQAHPEMKPQSDAIIAAVEKLYQFKTINFTKKPRRSRGTFFLDYEMNPPDMWAGQKQSDFTKIRSDQEITHDDFSNAVESHPYLPLYVTGNQKGQLCLWEFNQMEDRSLDQWITEPGDQKSLDPKKTTIKKISFNQYGDKLFCNNLEGNIYVFNFDTKESSKTIPIYTLKRGKEDKLIDFDLISADTVYALTAQKPKRLWIYDTLLSSRGGLVLEAQQGGNILQPLRSKTQLLLFNGDKPGMMTVYDLKMNRVVSNLTLHSDEITSVDLNEAENTLVAGFKDGIIKIFNIDKNYDQRESYSAFSVAGNKKGGVSQVRIHPNNGALYASSTIGNFKLFRPRV